MPAVVIERHALCPEHLVPALQLRTRCRIKAPSAAPLTSMYALKHITKPRLWQGPQRAALDSVRPPPRRRPLLLPRLQPALADLALVVSMRLWEQRALQHAC